MTENNACAPFLVYNYFDNQPSIWYNWALMSKTVTENKANISVAHICIGYIADAVLPFVK